MSTTKANNPEPLSDQDALDLMKTWTGPRFLKRPWYHLATLRMRDALKGGQNVVIVGDPGTGKTMGVKRVIRTLTEEMEGVPENSVLEPVDSPIIHFSGSQAQGTKTALMDVLHALRGIAMSNSQKRQYSPMGAVSLIIDEMRERGVRLLCIDEAQMMDKRNAELVRQIPDSGDDVGYPVRLCLVGTAGIKGVLSATGQRGQRFPWEIEVRPLSKKELQESLTGLHPLLLDVQASMSPREWERLLSYLYDRTRGNLRRLASVIQGANSVGVALGQPLNAEYLRRSADDLAPE
jgi:DNA transposition AAA+ family ATPase